jgi:hypothetical protein
MLDSRTNCGFDLFSGIMPSRLQTPQARAQFEGFIEALFSLPSIAEVNDGLRTLAPPAPFRIRTKVVYTKLSLHALRAELLDLGRYEALSQTGPGLRFRKSPDRHEQSVFVAILPSAQPDVLVIVSVCDRESWHALMRSIRHRYPVIVPVWLSQRELLQGIAALRSRAAMHYELQVRDLTAKEILETPTGRNVKTVREWTHAKWEEAVRVVSARRQIVTTVSLAFHRRIGEQIDVTPTALCKISKKGEIDLTGNFDLLWEQVISHIAEVGERKLSFYSKRGLRERHYRPAPLAINYSADVFDDPSEIRRLVATLAKYPKSMHSVQHGNPYAYVQVADSYDGSTFDVWALSNQRITVVPRLKATEAAVGRLIQYIFDEFREGIVEEGVTATESAAT